MRLRISGPARRVSMNPSRWSNIPLPLYLSTGLIVSGSAAHCPDFAHE
jgi:hypothetical protein